MYQEGSTSPDRRLETVRGIVNSTGICQCELAGADPTYIIESYFTIKEDEEIGEGEE